MAVPSLENPVPLFAQLAVLQFDRVVCLLVHDNGGRLVCHGGEGRLRQSILHSHLDHSKKAGPESQAMAVVVSGHRIRQIQPLARRAFGRQPRARLNFVPSHLMKLEGKIPCVLISFLFRNLQAGAETSR